jgi:hypothetical protein
MRRAGNWVPALAGAIAVGAAGAAGSPAAVQDPPACTAAQLAGTREGIPVKIQDPSDPYFLGPEATLATLVTGRRYAAVVDETQATREGTATLGYSAPVTGSVRVTGPAGLALTPMTTRSTDFYAFKAPAPGPLRFQATWQQEVEDRISGATVICSAAATLDVAVVAPKLVLTRARFVYVYGQGDAGFELRVLNQTPADPRPVTALLRVRPGIATAPPATGRATKSITFNPLHMGSYSRVLYVHGPLRLEFGAESTNGGASVQVDPGGNFPFGTQLRFGFSVELRQGGRSVGGMRSGVVCNRVQLATHSEARCSHPGFAARP